MTTKEEILAEIARLGSVAAAARELGITRQAISKQFLKLDPKHPLRIRYKALTKLSKRGPSRAWEDQAARDRAKSKAYRERNKSQEEG